MKKSVLAVAAAFAVIAGSVAPVTAVQAQSGDRITLRVCNNTNQVAQVAVSYKPLGSNSFYNEGWYNINPRECRNLAESGNSYLYGYAEVEGSDTDTWSGNHPLCVEFPGPYDFWTQGTVCAPHQEVRNFVELYAANWGVFTWNLDY